MGKAMKASARKRGWDKERVPGNSESMYIHIYVCNIQVQSAYIWICICMYR